MGRRFQFTLRVLLTAAVISALLALLVVDSWRSAGLRVTNDARRGSCEALLCQLEQALKMYEMDHGELPLTLEVLRDRSIVRGFSYFEFRQYQLDTEKRVLDPWGRPLVYRIHREEGKFKGKVAKPDRFELYSAGPNGIDDGSKGDDVTAGE